MTNGQSRMRDNPPPEGATNMRCRFTFRCSRNSQDPIRPPHEISITVSRKGSLPRAVVSRSGTSKLLQANPSTRSFLVGCLTY